MNDDVLIEMFRRAQKAGGRSSFNAVKRLVLDGEPARVYKLVIDDIGETETEYAIVKNDGTAVKTGMTFKELYDWNEKYNENKVFNATAHKTFWYAIADAIRQMKYATECNCDRSNTFFIDRLGKFEVKSFWGSGANGIKRGVMTRTFKDFLNEDTISLCYACEYATNSTAHEETDCDSCPLIGMEFCTEDSVFDSFYEHLNDMMLEDAIAEAISIAEKDVRQGVKIM